MEYVIRVIWDTDIQRDRKDLEILADWAMENISWASKEVVGDEELFPIADRITNIFDDNSGFRIDMSGVIETDDEESTMRFMEVVKIILENAGVNLEHVRMSYERI